MEAPDAFLQTDLELHARISAVIMEPIMCHTGCILPREGYLAGVQRVCRQYSIVFILDEIIAGFRVGLFGAQGYFGITPDLATLGKAMAGGFLVSCLAGKREMMELIGKGPSITRALSTAT